MAKSGLLTLLFIATAALQASDAAAAGPPKVDPAKLHEAQSLIAEAIVIGELESRSRITRPYARGQREDIRKGLENLAKAPGLAELAETAKKALDQGDLGALTELRDRLVQSESPAWAP
jgi:hypothetical protein